MAEIDRTKWATDWRPALGIWAVTLDGHDAGIVFQDNEEFFPMLENNEPLDGRMPPTFGTVEAASGWVREQWQGWWAYCSECGGPTTESDRRWPGVDVPVAVTCAVCRRGAGQLRIAGLPVERS